MIQYNQEELLQQVDGGNWLKCKERINEVTDETGIGCDKKYTSKFMNFEISWAALKIWKF